MNTVFHRRLAICPMMMVAWAVKAEAQLPPARVTVAPILQRDVQAGQVCVGTVMPLRTSVIGAAVGGRVEEFLVNEGDRVAKGQPLAKLRTQIIEAEVAAARAELAARTAELEELQNGSRPEEIEQAKARLTTAETIFELRHTSLERVRAAGLGATRQEVDEALSAYQQSEASRREARAALKILVDGPRKERIAQAKARTEAAQAELRRLQEQLARHTIYSPFDGYVVAEHCEVGQWLNQGALVADVVELDTVDVEVHVVEDYVPHLREGMSARVELPALPNETFTGQVALIVPRANLRARTFPVKVRVENRRVGKSVLLKGGMFARVALPVGPKEPALLVPKDALVLGGPTPMIYVVQPDAGDPKKGVVRPVAVQLGVADDNLIQVKGDVKASQLVAVLGNERLRPGAEVQIVTQDAKAMK